MFNPEITVGNIVTALAVLVSAAGILVALHKERALRKKEHADRVRQATALVVAKLDRWKQLSLQLFDELQSAVTDADAMLVANGDRIATRDYLWKKTVEAQASVARRILDEAVEVAYSNLYGYDPRIHELFTGAVLRLRRINGMVFVKVLNRTQSDILTMPKKTDSGEILSAQLGNRLRVTLARAKGVLEGNMETVLNAFREGMLPIVRASDEALAERKVAVPSPDILPDLRCLEFDILSASGDDRESCRFVFDSLGQSQTGTIADPWPLGIEFPEEPSASIRAESAT